MMNIKLISLQLHFEWYYYDYIRYTADFPHDPLSLTIVRGTDGLFVDFLL